MIRIINLERLNQVKLILNEIKLTKFKIFASISTFYFFTLMGAFLEGLALILLASVFTGGINDSSNALDISSSIVKYLDFPILELSIKEIVLIIITIYFFAFIIRFSEWSFYGWILATLRKKLQEIVFKKYINAPWFLMKDFPVGTASNTNIQETQLSVRYIFKLLLCGNYLLQSFAFMILATLIDYKTFILLSFVSIPIIFLLRLVIKYQTILSKKMADLRNLFSSNIVDRLNGLFQIQLEKDFDNHFNKGIAAQQKWTRFEIIIGLCQALISTLIVIVPLVCLSIFYFLYDEKNSIDTFSIATVILLGIKLFNQLNSFIVNYTDLSRLSGSLYPVCEVLKIEQRKLKQKVSEKINSIIISKISFKFKNKFIFKNINLEINKGRPLVIQGRSGVGKTTLVNIISGVYSPSQGSIIYKGNKNLYNNQVFDIIVGYVAQDIYLFNGSIRENLDISNIKSDKDIWKCLKLIDAEKFVKNMGGLDAYITENGKSLSGGQKRRIGIARALLLDSELLIFDEITNGLDYENVEKLNKVVKRLSLNHLMIYISHTKVNFENQKILKL